MIRILIALLFAALTCLVLAMPAHYRRIFPEDSPGAGTLRTWRFLGWAGMFASLIYALRAGSWQVGLVTWVVMLAVSGAALTLLLTYAPRRVPAIAGVVLVLAVGELVVSWWR